MRRILLSGASGLIGRALLGSFGPQVQRCEAEIVRLVRGPAKKPEDISWDPFGPLPSATVSGFDAVIHLAGESVVGRWTPAKKKAIHDSRVMGTRNLVSALTQSEIMPSVLVCASAVGYYGDRADEVLRENSPAGRGFLSEVCREWEDATRSASAAGIRTLNLRIGLVLSKRGGALEKILTPFKLGLGGRIGDGQQWWSWIHIDDLVAAIHHALDAPSLFGPVNMVAPNQVRNAEFTKVLARVLGRPAFLPVPKVALRLVFGKAAAEEMFLSSQRVEPEKLQKNGYVFRYPQLEAALENLV